MQNLYEEVNSLDKRCYHQYALTEDILMEHAAEGIHQYIRQKFSLGSRIQIVSGSGNNGADGIVLARLLHPDYRVTLYLPRGVKSPMAKLQLSRAEALGITSTEGLQTCDVLVDALYGSGFSGEFDEETQHLLQNMNALHAHKIACDMPSGLSLDGTAAEKSFIADITLTMGALKRGQFSDSAKNLTGIIQVVDLGVSRTLYEQPGNWHLLDLDDLLLPLRKKADTNKGSYGHLGVICGEKEGAAILSGGAALRFGTGLVTLISNTQVHLPHELMQSHLLPQTITAIAAGMGLGQEFSEKELNALFEHNLPMVIDADLFSHAIMTGLLRRNAVVLTPHPKEFTHLLKVCGIADISVETLQNNRFHYAKLFYETYPNAVLLLKGANVIIAGESHFYINPHGSNTLAKGGSGDVLTGLIGALLAQGYTPLDAAIHGSLAHTAAASAYTGNNYAMTPLDLIENLIKL